MGRKCLERLTRGTAVCSLSPALEEFVKQAFCEADPGIPVVLHGGEGGFCAQTLTLRSLA